MRGLLSHRLGDIGFQQVLNMQLHRYLCLWSKDKDSDEVACSKLVENLYLLNDDLKVPSPKSLGHSADKDMFRLMASQALASGSPQNNPRVPTKNQIVQLYEEVWG